MHNQGHPARYVSVAEALLKVIERPRPVVVARAVVAADEHQQVVGLLFGEALGNDLGAEEAGLC